MVSFFLSLHFTWFVYQTCTRSCHLDGQLSFSLCINKTEIGLFVYGSLDISSIMTANKCPGNQMTDRNNSNNKNKKERKNVKENQYIVIQNSEQLQNVKHECFSRSFLVDSFQLILRLNFFLSQCNIWKQQFQVIIALSCLKIKLYNDGNNFHSQKK